VAGLAVVEDLRLVLQMDVIRALSQSPDFLSAFLNNIGSAKYFRVRLLSWRDAGLFATANNDFSQGRFL